MKQKVITITFQPDPKKRNITFPFFRHCTLNGVPGIEAWYYSAACGIRSIFVTTTIISQMGHRSNEECIRAWDFSRNFHTTWSAFIFNYQSATRVRMRRVIEGEFYE